MKKIITSLFIFVFSFMFINNVNAITITESTDPTDGLTTIQDNSIVIGVTRFEDGVVITAQRAATAGVNDALFNIGVDGYSGVNIYYYLGGSWFVLDDENQANPLDESNPEDQETIEELESPEIYYVNNVEKQLTVDFTFDGEGNLEFNTDNNKDGLVSFADGKLTIPATVKSLQIEIKDPDSGEVLGVVVLKKDPDDNTQYDKTSLTAYNAALAAVVEADYTEASWATYQGVVSLNVVTAESTQGEVDTATSKITTAQGSLVFAGKAALDAAKAVAGGLTESTYTIATWSVLTTALGLPETTNALILTKTTAITTAISNLVVKADLTAYNAALAAVVEADYTVESWEAYQLVVAANGVTVANSQAEVDAATLAITTAQADLVEVPVVVGSIAAAVPTADGKGTGTTNIGKYTVGTATGTSPNFATVITGTEALVDVESANAVQGTAKWVGVLITTDKDVTSLAVKTPGMAEYANLTQADIDEAVVGGATGTKTFVWWLKSEELTAAKDISIKVQGENDSTAVKLSVTFDEYVAPVVVGSIAAAVPTADGKGTGTTNIGKYTVGTATGTSPNFATVITGTEALVDVESANAVQGTAKWVGVLITTDKDVTSLAVKTPGMAEYANLTQADIDEAVVGGATGTKTFVWWLKSEELTAAKDISIKVQGENDSTAVKLSVTFDEYVAPVVVGSIAAAVPTADGKGTGTTNIGKYTVGTATGTSPNFATVITGTEALVDVESANAVQGTAKWVGVLITTDKDVTSLAVKTPGMAEYANLTQADIDEAVVGGATGTKTFVWWLKSEELTAAKDISIKVQGENDSTAVKLSVTFDEYVAPVVVGSIAAAVPTADGKGTGTTNIGKYTVGTATGTSPNFATVITGTEALVDVESANAVQGTAKWVGVLITTDKDVTSLAVKTPGMAEYANLTQADIDEAVVGGATGTKTFVWWLKSEELTAAKDISIKVQGENDSTAVKLSVTFDEYVAPVVVGSIAAAVPTADGKGTGTTNIGKYTVGTATGTSPNFATVITGTEALVDVESANAVQGTAKWVGVLITTDKDVTSLAVKTPGMAEYANLTQADIDEAVVGGATGTKTFVWWLKSEELTAAKDISIKVQGENDSTAVKLSVTFDEYVAPVVVGSIAAAVPTADGKGTGTTNIGKYTVGTATGTSPNFATVITGTEALVDVESANAVQGTAKWVGVLITTDKDVTSLAVKTPGMAEYANLTQADIDEAVVGGATGTKTFVWWLKSEELTAAKDISIKVQGENDSTAVKLSVTFDEYVAPVVVGSIAAAVPTADGKGTGTTNIGKYTVGTATGTSPNFATVITGTEALVDVESANAVQGTAKWVGVLITTDKDVTSLAVKTPGMAEYANLTQADIDEAVVGGATGTKTFVWWLKSEELTAAKDISIKVQGENDSTAVKLSVTFDEYVAPVVVGSIAAAVPTADGKGTGTTNIGKYTVGTATGTSPNFATVITGTEALVDVESANAVQGTAKWVGVLITTDKDVTSLAVKTPGMAEYANLTQADIDEAVVGGATGTKTFVWWLKSEELTAAKDISIKVQGENDSTAVKLSVTFDEYN